MILLRIIPAYAGSTKSASMRSSPVRSRVRIIPAYAGSTRTGSSQPLTLPDHPRLRGEHDQPQDPDPGGEGSSPPTRGARGGTTPGRAAAGIIPAYAGSTRTVNRLGFGAMDHPRLRGEHIPTGCVAGIATGSSPPTRGAQFWHGYTPSCLGIIPAYAGSTMAHTGSATGATDHPRLRGEHPRP